MRRTAELALAAAALALPLPALAQEAEPSLIDRAYAAGYKAAFTCSALWQGHKSLADIEADELTGIYDNVADIVPTLSAEVDEDRMEVRVKYAEDRPPRTAVWREALGCTQLPIGADPDTADLVPRFSTTNGYQTFDGRLWPMGDRDAADPRIQMLLPIDRVAMDAMGTGEDGKTYGGRSSGLVIVHNGRIVQERYKPGHDMHTAQRTWSVAKSIAITLIGAAVQQGHIDVARPTGLSYWQTPGDPRAQITTEHLMRMASGLESDTAGNRTDPIYMGGAAIADRAPRWPLLRNPGSHYRYANNDTLLAYLAMQEKLPEEDRLGWPVRLFTTLGMTRTVAETDWQGNFVISSQVWTTPRDLARLGLLYLNDGIWYGAPGEDIEPMRLLPEGWRALVSTPSGPQPDGPFGYGAGFWLLNKSEGIPADAIGMFGNRGQYVVIVPSRDLVIVRRGYDTAEDRFDIATFTRDVVAALAE